MFCFVFYPLRLRLTHTHTPTHTLTHTNSPYTRTHSYRIIHTHACSQSPRIYSHTHTHKHTHTHIHILFIFKFPHPNTHTHTLIRYARSYSHFRHTQTCAYTQWHYYTRTLTHTCNLFIGVFHFSHTRTHTHTHTLASRAQDGIWDMPASQSVARAQRLAQLMRALKRYNATHINVDPVVTDLHANHPLVARYLDQNGLVWFVGCVFFLSVRTGSVYPSLLLKCWFDVMDALFRITNLIKYADFEEGEYYNVKKNWSKLINWKKQPENETWNNKK